MSLFNKKKQSEEFEMAGDVIKAPAKATTTIRARVLDADGNEICNLGTIVGRRTKAEGEETRKLLEMLRLKAEEEQRRLKAKELNDGS